MTNSCDINVFMFKMDYNTNILSRLISPSMISMGPSHSQPLDFHKMLNNLILCPVCQVYSVQFHYSGLCCGNHQSQRPMTTQAVNLLVWISSGKFTRELDKESLLNQSPIYTEYTWSVLHPHVCLISYSRPLCCIHMS